jgi:putative DNA primase/helicase
VSPDETAEEPNWLIKEREEAERWAAQLLPDEPPSTNGTAPPDEHPHPDVFMNDKGAVQITRLAAYVQRLGHVCTGEDGRLYRYRRGVYLPDGELFASVSVKEILQGAWRSRHAEETVRNLKASYPRITDTPPEQWINCANGLLNWRTGVLRQHTPDVATTVQLPIPWDPEATCPNIDRFLDQALPADALPLLLEYVGLTLYPGNPFRKALLLLGPSGTGKSKLLSLIAALVGAPNLAAVPIQVLAENRFAAAELFGKLANISGDLDARAIRQTDTFKMVTGGDPIMAERKHGQPFSFRPFCAFLFAANEAPISSDQTDAWFERWLVIPLENKPERPDPHLLGRLTTPAELSGLMARAVASLQALMARGEFAPPESVAAANETYRERLDTARGYVNDECVLDLDAWTPRAALYKQYSQWCRDGGRLPVSATNFYDHLRRNHPGEVTEAKRKGVRGFAGLAIRGAEDATPFEPKLPPHDPGDF